MNKLAKRAWFSFALAAVLLVGILGITVEYFIKAEKWVPANSDSIVTDRSGTVLLDTTDGRRYADSETLRKATLHLLGDKEGNIPRYILNAYGDKLSGFDLINGTYNTGGENGQMTLTISADVQRTALNALNGYHGTVGVYNYKTGEILCMVSSPNYDPENVPDIAGDPERYDGAYLNRFIDVTYTPGSTFKLVTAVAALSELDDISERSFYCEGSAQIGSETVICNGVHGEVTLGQALEHSCNVAFAELAEELGPDVLTEYAKRLGVTSSLSFDGFRTKAGKFDVQDATTFEAAWAGVGQYTDLINPCQYMVFMGAIANGGSAAIPHIVERVSCGDKVKYTADTEMTERLIERSVASELAEMMHDTVTDIYGEWNFAGLYAGAKSGTAERGEGQTANALLVGFVEDSDYPLAFVVVVEGGGSGSAACTPIISQVLNACVVAMDQF